MSCFFDSFDEIPVWTHEGKFAVCVDAKTGKELKRVSLENEYGLNPNQSMPVRLLKDINLGSGRILEKGEVVNLYLTFSGEFYLMIGIICVKVNPIKGIDFELGV